MNFLNPFVLYGLAAASIPLLIHLISRRRVRTVPFPSVRLLERMKTDRLRLLRLKQLIVLILRTLAIALLVVAFARPALRSAFRWNADTAVVIVLDASVSTAYVENGEMLFNRGVRAAGSVIDMLGSGDAVAVIVADELPVLVEPGITRDHRRLSEALVNLHYAGTSGSVSRALGRARELLASSGTVNRELYLVTDGITEMPPDSTAGAEDIRQYLVLLGPDSREGAVIDRIELLDPIPVQGEPLRVRVTGRFGPAGGGTDVSVFIDGDRLDKSWVSNTTGGEFETMVAVTPETTGWHTLAATVDGGFFAPGETRWLTFRVPDPVEVLLVAPGDNDARYVEAALAAGESRPPFSVRRLTPGAVTAADIRGADAVVLSGVEGLDAPVYDALVVAVVDGGCGVVCMLPDDPRTPLYEQGVFRDLFPAETLRTVGSTVPGAEMVSRVDWLDPAHPIPAGISASGNIGRPEISAYAVIEPAEQVRVFARLTDGSMAAGSTLCGEGRVVVWVTDAAVRRSDFAVTGMFAPAIIGSVVYALGMRVEGTDYPSGVPLHEDAGADPSAAIDIKPAEGVARRVTGVQVNGRLETAGETAGDPGWYAVLADGRETGRFSVNVPDGELAFVRGREQPEGFRVIRDAGSIAEAVRDDRYGTELSGIVLALALVLFGLEMVVARKL